MVTFKKAVSVGLVSLVLASIALVPVTTLAALPGTPITISVSPAPPSGFDPSPNSRQQAVFTYKIWGPANGENIVIKAYKTLQGQGLTCDTSGAVSVIEPVVTRAPGTYSVAWDGKNTFGAVVAPGTYCYRLVWSNSVDGNPGLLAGYVIVNQPAANPPGGGSNPGGSNPGGVVNPGGNGGTGNVNPVGGNPCTNSNLGGPILSSVDPSVINPNDANSLPARICYFVNQDLPNGFTLKIYDNGDQVVKEMIGLYGNFVPRGTSETKSWNGKDYTGRSVTPGNYTYQFRVSGVTVASGTIQVVSNNGGVGGNNQNADIFFYSSPGLVIIDPVANTTIQAADIFFTVNRKFVTGLAIVVRDPRNNNATVDRIYYNGGTHDVRDYGPVSWGGRYPNGTPVAAGDYTYVLISGGREIGSGKLQVQHLAQQGQNQNQGPFIVSERLDKTSFMPSNNESVTMMYTLGKTVNNFKLSVRNPGGPDEVLVPMGTKTAGTYSATWNGKFGGVNGVNAGKGYYVFAFEAQGENTVFDSVYVDAPIIQQGQFIVGFSATPSSFTPSNNETTNITYTLGKAVNNFQLTVRNQLGAIVATLVSATGKSAGTYPASWDGKIGVTPVTPGPYTLVFEATGEVTVTGQVAVLASQVNQNPLVITDLFPNPNPMNPNAGGTTFSFQVNQDARAELTITDANNTTVRRLLVSNNANNVTANVTKNVPWDGRGDPAYNNGQIVAGNPTTYTYTIQVSSNNPQQLPQSKTGQVVVVTGGQTQAMDVYNSIADPFNADTQNGTLKFTLNQAANVTVTIYRADNNAFVRTITTSQNFSNVGVNSVTWDGFDSATPRALVPATLYKFIVDAVSTINTTTDRDTGFVTVTRNSNVGTGTMSLTDLRADPFNADTQNGVLRFTTNQDANITVTVYRDDTGTLVKTFSNQRFTAGPNSVIWNGTDQYTGITVPAARYRFLVEASSTQGGGSANGVGYVTVTRNSGGGNSGSMYVYGLTADPFNADNETGYLKFSLNQDANVTVTAYRSDNNAFVKTVASNQFFRSGSNSVPWNGTDQFNAPAPQATYKFTVDAVSTQGGGSSSANGFVNLNRNGSQQSTLQITDNGPNPTTFNPSNGQTTQITFSTNMTPSTTQVRVYDTINSAFIRNLPITSISANSYRADWNGREEGRNQIVPDGTYQYRIYVTSGSQSAQKLGYVYVGVAGNTGGTGGTTYNYTGNCGGFPDVSRNSYLCPALDFVRTKGIFTGYTNGEIGVDNVIQRAELLAVIQKAFKYQLDSYNANIDGNLGFRDLNTSAWYMPYFKTFIRLGLIAGYPDGYMRPNRTMNTAELYLVLLKAAKQSPQKVANFKLEEHIVYKPPFSDTPVNSRNQWYLSYAEFAQLNDLVTTDRFYPERGITRGQVIQLIYDTYRKGLISY